MDMFCYQCEQTAGGTGCTARGVCGKSPEVAALQDLLVHALKGCAMYAHRARELGQSDPELDAFTAKALFTTLTNVNFDPDALAGFVRQAAQLRDRARRSYEAACRQMGDNVATLGGPAAWEPAAGAEGLLEQGRSVTIRSRIDGLGADVAGLQELTPYGLKGAAAYAHHAHLLGQADDDLFASFQRLLASMTEEPIDPDQLVATALEVGGLNLRAMELLDTAHTSTYGHPEPTLVRVTPLAGKAILVSGHDLRDLAALLDQAAGRGVNVYTHGEMLPAHAYPELKKHGHLVGNYGGAWQNQRSEFDEFPGAILMTTNCLQEPKESYRGRLFTTGPVGWPGCAHIGDGDFSAVVDATLAAPGFAQDSPRRVILVGFGHHAVLAVASQIVEAVKSRAVRHLFLIGGCDGARPGRNYYTDLAQAVPEDCLILTLACGKYRFNKLDFGTVAGLPRLLDVGQCNDAYSAVMIARALADAFHTDVNGLPLSLILSWYEQKAVAILLTLLHLGVRDIRIGPSLPAFVSPRVLDVLVEKFGIAPISTPARDLHAALAPSRDLSLL
jgi:hydroxylamine reductase